MTCKDQNKILDDKIESNVKQYKVDKLNAEMSAFSSGDLNKYEFLTRKDLKYKPNALDKTRFEFSPLGKRFSIGLDKTAQGYQEEGVIKLLKDIRDGLEMIIGLMIIDLMIHLMMIHLIHHMIHHIHQMMKMILKIIKTNMIIYCLNIFN